MKQSKNKKKETFSSNIFYASIFMGFSLGLYLSKIIPELERWKFSFCAFAMILMAFECFNFHPLD